MLQCVTSKEVSLDLKTEKKSAIFECCRTKKCCHLATNLNPTEEKVLQEVEERLCEDWYTPKSNDAICYIQKSVPELENRKKSAIFECCRTKKCCLSHQMLLELLTVAKFEPNVADEGHFKSLKVILKHLEVIQGRICFKYAAGLT